MLEIILVVVLWKKMGEMMRGKGYDKPFWFQFFVPVCWLGGEFTGGFVFYAIRGQQVTGFDIPLYVVALAGAAIATIVMFFYAARQPQASPPSDLSAVIRFLSLPPGFEPVIFTDPERERLYNGRSNAFVIDLLIGTVVFVSVCYIGVLLACPRFLIHSL